MSVRCIIFPAMTSQVLVSLGRPSIWSAHSITRSDRQFAYQSLPRSRLRINSSTDLGWGADRQIEVGTVPALALETQNLFTDHRSNLTRDKRLVADDDCGEEVAWEDVRMYRQPFVVDRKVVAKLRLHHHRSQDLGDVRATLSEQRYIVIANHRAALCCLLDRCICKAASARPHLDPASAGHCSHVLRTRVAQRTVHCIASAYSIHTAIACAHFATWSSRENSAVIAEVAGLLAVGGSGHKSHNHFGCRFRHHFQTTADCCASTNAAIAQLHSAGKSSR